MLETVNRKVKRYIKNRGKKRKIKKEKKVRADFLKDFSKARGVPRRARDKLQVGCGECRHPLAAPTA